jgi:hypothetical protein
VRGVNSIETTADVAMTRTDASRRRWGGVTVIHRNSWPTSIAAFE